MVAHADPTSPDERAQALEKVKVFLKSRPNQIPFQVWDGKELVIVPADQGPGTYRITNLAGPNEVLIYQGKTEILAMRRYDNFTGYHKGGEPIVIKARKGEAITGYYEFIPDQ